MTRWLVTGAGGMLGSDLVEQLRAANQFVVGFGHQELDVTNVDVINEALASVGADVVINTAAYTRVDDAESDEPNAALVNGVAPGLLATACAAHQARLVHLSTDYVFPGNAIEPYETDAATGPAGAYGRTKLAGELWAITKGEDVHVVRSAWLYGENGSSFVRSVGRRLLQGEPVEVVDDQRGAPTWTGDLAGRLVALGTADVGPGIWHCSAAGAASWYDVAVAVAQELGCDSALVRPTTSAALRRPAPRPAYSVLSNRKWIDAGLPAMPHWRDALHEAFTQLGAALTD